MTFAPAKDMLPSMQRSGRNLGRYLGQTLDIAGVLQASLEAARRHGWQVEFLPVEPGFELLAMTRAPLHAAAWAPRIYLSTGIHGDEPAGPLAIEQLLAGNALPTKAWLWLCPCLNPTGFPLNTREAASG